MSAVRPFIDPEVALLLRETIHDPNAELFKASDPRRLAGVAGLTRPISARRAGLAAAERHLLQTYREEAAWLLRQAALTRLYEDPGNADILETSITIDRDIELMRAPEWIKRVARIKDRGSLDDVPESCWTLSDEASVESLCEASCRLVPSHEAQIYMAFNANRGGRYDEVSPILKGVLASYPTVLNQAYVWESFGYLYSNTRQIGCALDSYRRGASTSECRPAAVLQWMHMAVRSGDEREIVRAAAVLDDMIAPDHSAVDDHVRRKRALVGSLTESVLAIVADVRDGFGPTSRRATDVYFQS